MFKTVARNIGVVIFISLFIFVSNALGQEKQFPDRPINLYVGYPPGGGTGNAAQIVAEGLARNLNQPVIVNFKPGASQAVAGDFVRKSKPDGYNLLFSGEPDFTSKLVKDASLLRYTIDDFVPLGSAPYTPYSLAVNAESQWKTLDDLIAYARNKPPKTLSFGHVGDATVAHLAGELFQQLTGIVLTAIPFQGGGPADTALMGGHIDMCFGTIGGRFGARTKPGGGLRLLAVLDKKRTTDYPDVPTMQEKGYKMRLVFYGSLLAPKGLPNDVKATLVRALEKTSKDPEIVRLFINAGYMPVYITPEEQKEQIKTDSELFHSILVKLGLINK